MSVTSRESRATVRHERAFGHHLTRGIATVKGIRSHAALLLLLLMAAAPEAAAKDEPPIEVRPPIRIPCCGGKPAYHADKPGELDLVVSSSVPYAFTGPIAVVTSKEVSSGGTQLLIIDLSNVDNPDSVSGGNGVNISHLPTYTSQTVHYWRHPSWVEGGTSSTGIGNVFGLTLDDAGSIYVAASPLLGSSVWNASSNSWVAAVPANAATNALKPAGQGGIYKIPFNDPNPIPFVKTWVSPTYLFGVPNLLPNTGPGLGNIHFSCKHQRLYASNMEDGFIYSFDPLGTLMDRWDHGTKRSTAVNACASMPALTTASIPDSGTSGFTQLGRRVWAVQVLEDRLYYSVWSRDHGTPSGPANEIWSVAIDPVTGGFPASSVPVREIILSQGTKSPVADISFGPSGNMLLAERSVTDQAPWPTLAMPHVSSVREYWRSACSGGGLEWVPTANAFEVGDYSTGHNASGGCDYDFARYGANLPGRVWYTGDALTLGSQPFVAYGLQGAPMTGTAALGATTSLVIDFDEATGTGDKTFIGDVEIPCPPPSKDPCELLWGTEKADECCGYHVGLTTAAGPIQSVSFSVSSLGGTVIGFTPTTGCAFTPAVVPATSGTVTFGTGGCTSPIQLDIAAATTGSSAVGIILTVVLVGVDVPCTKRIKFECCTSVARCDEITWEPGLCDCPNTNPNLKWKRFAIVNQKLPPSNICSVEIAYYDSSNTLMALPPAGTTGMPPLIDTVPAPSWGHPYQQILLGAANSNLQGLEAQSTVEFLLGIDHTYGWVGTVQVTVKHCDGGVCVERFPWTPTGARVDPTWVRATGGKAVEGLRAYRIQFTPEQLAGRRIRWLGLEHDNEVKSLVAITGAAMPSAARGRTEGAFDEVRMSGGTAMLRLRPTAERRARGALEATVVYAPRRGANPRVEVVYYDGSGAAVGRDTVVAESAAVGGGRSPEPAVDPRTPPTPVPATAVRLEVEGSGMEPATGTFGRVFIGMQSATSRGMIKLVPGGEVEVGRERIRGDDLGAIHFQWEGVGAMRRPTGTLVRKDGSAVRFPATRDQAVISIDVIDDVSNRVLYRWALGQPSPRPQEITLVRFARVPK